VDRREDRVDHRVDALGVDVRDLQAAALGAVGEDRGRPGDDRPDRRVVRLDERRQQLQEEHGGGRVEGPLPHGQHPDRDVGGAQLLAGRGDRDEDLGGGLLLELGEVPRVEADRGMVDDEGYAGAQAVDVVRQGRVRTSPWASTTSVWTMRSSTSPSVGGILTTMQWRNAIPPWAMA
jgi:hypothetical protein